MSNYGLTTPEGRQAAFGDPWSLLLPSGSITSQGREALLGGYPFATSSGSSDVIITASERYVPINWIPRWMSTNYSSTGIIKTYYFTSLYKPRKKIEEVSEELIGLKFFGSTGLDRISYKANYRYDINKGYIPVVKLHTTIASSIPRVETVNSMLDNRTSPTWTVYDNQLLLHNLAVTTHLVSSFNGVVDLSSTFSSDPPIEDSWYLIINTYGDEFPFYKESPQFKDNKYYLGFSGSFYITYLSQTVYNQISSGQAYITVDDEKVSLSEYTLRNKWDSYGELLNLHRRHNESNVELKTKCQQLSLVGKDAEKRIAVILGTGDMFQWAVGNLSLVGSGYNNVSLVGAYDKYIIDEAAVVKVGNYFTLNYVPSGYVQVMYDQKIVPSDTYTVSGSIIIFDSITLQSAVQGTIRAKYTTYNYTVNSSGSQVTDIQRHNEISDMPLVIATKHVKLSSTSKHINKWIWNRENGRLNGLANFNT